VHVVIDATSLKVYGVGEPQPPHGAQPLVAFLIGMMFAFG